MSKAATLIQTKYRRYCEHKRFKKSQEAATCIQTFYRTYKEGQSRSRESTPTTAGLKYNFLISFAFQAMQFSTLFCRRTYSQRRQNQAAKKIQQFMRKSHLRYVSNSTYFHYTLLEKQQFFKDLHQTCLK